MRTISGTRLALRPVRLDDAPTMLALYQQNATYLRPWDPPRPAGFYSLEYQREVIRTGLTDQAGDRGYTYGVIIQSSGALVGRVRLSSIVRGAFQNAYLGYWLAEACAGQGLMTEAVGLVVVDAFGHLGLHRIQAATLPHNYGSIRVLTKNRFRREGLAERYLLIDGRWQDHVLFARTRDE